MSIRVFNVMWFSRVNTPMAAWRFTGLLPWPGADSPPTSIDLGVFEGIKTDVATPRIRYELPHEIKAQKIAGAAMLVAEFTTLGFGHRFR